MAASSSKNPEKKKSFVLSIREEEEWMFKYLTEWTPRLVFVENVLSFVMLEKRVPYSTQMFASTKGSRPDNPVGNGLDKCFQNLIKLVGKDVEDFFEENVLPQTYECFRDLTLQQTMEVGRLKWDPAGYLAYCVIMSMMACLAYSNGIRKAPQFAVLLMMWLLDVWSQCKMLPQDYWSDMIYEGDQIANLRRFQDVSWMKVNRDYEERKRSRYRRNLKKDARRRERDRRGEGTRMQDRDRERDFEKDRQREKDFQRWRRHVNKSIEKEYDFDMGASDDSGSSTERAADGYSS